MYKELMIKPGVLVRDKDMGVNGEILELTESGEFVMCEVLWERKIDGVYSTIEFIEDLEVVR